MKRKYNPYSIEDRITLETDKGGNPTLQLIPFMDLGTVWNAPNNPNSLPDQIFIAGTGLGLLWEALPGLSIQTNYALPLIQLDDRGGNLQDNGIYFNMNYQL